MIAIVILTFIIGYLSIVFEHPLKLDKTVPALLMGAVMWALVSIGYNFGLLEIIDGHAHTSTLLGITDPVKIVEGQDFFTATLIHHIGKIAEILIFLIGAMTIVEIIDMHRGFEVLKESIKTKNKRKLLVIITFLSFFLSSIIDNLTTTIVMISLLRKLIKNRDERLWYVCLVIIAANAGGAWSPIGDVTTTMLWIGKKVSTENLIINLILPSIICTLVPLFFAMRKKIFDGELTIDNTQEENQGKLLSSKTMLILGLFMIVFVPIFKTLTHLPPYIGMMLSMAVVWLVSEYIHPEENFTEELKHKYSPHKALSRIELSSILFFLGILMAVAALETMVVGGVGTLQYLAQGLENAIPDQNFVIIFLGIMSAVIDNVPLVAASMGMYTFPIDHSVWHFIAYAAGTGGSMLIIGSAAGVAAMGMERIDFIWYFKKITLYAFIGYISGCILYIAMSPFLHGS
ncbi:MAG: sodium:proton antiporter NhaD [Saprospiraceae bacterium]|nr:sodium:proton antiporter NhaD [Saprospiraceae bacterium]